MKTKKYYPNYWSGCNPPHHVKDWSLVRSLIRACKNGKADTIPPIYIEGTLGNGNLITGTHRAAANDIITMLNERNDVQIELISWINVNNYLTQEQFLEVIEQDDPQESIDSIIQDYFSE